MSDNTVVLAFSGGLDTSFCVPWLKEQGFEVVTVFVDTGGVSREERRGIEQRAETLGVAQHYTLDGAEELFTQIVVPLIRAGRFYQDQYPVLCADRYVVVNKALEICAQHGTRKIAHGCTAMGNDQVRFDLSVMAAGDYEIVSPVRDIQQQTDNPRAFEQAYLAERGIEVEAKTTRYTINENLLGVTISGSEIDRFERPADDVWKLTANAQSREPTFVDLGFEHGVPVTLDGDRLAGPQLLAELNRRLGAHGVGRGIYTGDTAVGLKGRIVFEAPALTGLQAACRALAEATSTRNQNAFRPLVGERWVELVYFGFYNDPLRHDLEVYLESAAQTTSGRVTLEVGNASVRAVAVDSSHILSEADAVYAQSAGWSAEEARGFIRLFGQSARQWTAINGRRG